MENVHCVTVCVPSFYSRHSSQASGSEVSSLLFADIVVLLVSSSYNLQLALREICCQAGGNWDENNLQI